MNMDTNGTLATLREEHTRLRLETRVAELKARKSVLEGIMDSVRIADPLEKYRNGNELFIPIGGGQEKSKHGGNWPIFQNEQELFEIIGSGRVIGEGNCYGIGLLNGLTSYVIGSGFIYHAEAKHKHTAQPELVSAVQEVIDDFIELNAWSEMEQELFRRTRRDGEAFLRYYEDEGQLIIRTIEPEQVVKPASGSQKEWSFGIQVQTDPHVDLMRRLSYHVAYTGDASDGEQVDAAEIDHIKVNVDRIVKRGLSDFFAAQETLEQARKLLRNMATGAGLLSALTLIRKHSNVTKDQVSGFVSSMASRTSTDANGQTYNRQTWRPGTTLDVPGNMDYVPPPLASANTGNYVAILQACLRCAGTRWNAPEFMTGDSSNANFASALVSESPFVRRCEMEQEFYRVRFLKVIKRAIRLAVENKKLPANVLSLIEINTEAPSIAVRDRYKEAQVFEIESRNNITSPQTWGITVGRDPEQEAKNIEEWRKEHPHLQSAQPDGALWQTVTRTPEGGQGDQPKPFRGAA